VRRALLVSQAFHLHRAVSLCRGLGIDADGVAARCEGCWARTLTYNTIREIPAAWKALYDRVSNRPPAVSSPASQEIAAALRG
jgi:vancomycin permeability regulator SanA